MISNIEKARRYLRLKITGVPKSDPTWPWNFDVKISGEIALRLSYNEFGINRGWELRKCIRGRWNGGTFYSETLEGVLDIVVATGATSIACTDSASSRGERNSAAT